jgi:hypothetical protein
MEKGFYPSYPQEIDLDITLTCCSHFGNGMTDLVPGSRIGEKHRCIQAVFSADRAKLTNLLTISVERWV